MAGGHRLEQFQRFFLLELQVHGRHFLAVQRFEDAGGDVGGEAFVEPEVLPGGVGHQVARPAVGQFVGDQVDQVRSPAMMVGVRKVRRGFSMPPKGNDGGSTSMS